MQQLPINLTSAGIHVEAVDGVPFNLTWIVDARTPFVHPLLE